jgi:hypothetical protein
MAGIRVTVLFIQESGSTTGSGVVERTPPRGATVRVAHDRGAWRPQASKLASGLHKSTDADHRNHPYFGLRKCRAWPIWTIARTSRPDTAHEWARPRPKATICFVGNMLNAVCSPLADVARRSYLDKANGQTTATIREESWRLAHRRAISEEHCADSSQWSSTVSTGDVPAVAVYGGNSVAGLPLKGLS